MVRARVSRNIPDVAFRPVTLFSFLSQTLHEAQAGRQCGEAGRGDGGRHPHHDLRVRGHVLQHAGAALLLLRLPGYDGRWLSVYTRSRSYGALVSSEMPQMLFYKLLNFLVWEY